MADRLKERVHELEASERRLKQLEAISAGQGHGSEYKNQCTLPSDTALRRAPRSISGESFTSTQDWVSSGSAILCKGEGPALMATIPIVVFRNKNLPEGCDTIVRASVQHSLGSPQILDRFVLMYLCIADMQGRNQQGPGLLQRMFSKSIKRNEHPSFVGFPKRESQAAAAEEEEPVPNIVILNSLTHNQLLDLLKVRGATAS